jgi:hypothetical protein
MSVLFGVVILMWPGAGALALVWLIGTYAIVFGALMVGFALRLRRHRGPAPAQHGDRTRPISNPPRAN